MNTPNNKRRRASQEKVEQAFITLIQKKDVSQITVTEIVQLAKINRSTFYSNYLDIIDLSEKVKSHMQQKIADLYAEELNSEGIQNFLKMLYWIKENSDMYHTYLKLGDVQTFEPNLLEAKGTSDSQDPEIEYHKAFFRAGFNAILRRWAAHDFQKSPEEIEAILVNEYSRELDF